MRLRGTAYERDRIVGASEDDDEDGVVIQWSDDDRWKFCKNNLVVAYLWGFLEEICLTTFVVQNIERIGFVNGQVGSAKDAQGSKRSKRKKKDQIFEQSMKRLQTMMERCILSVTSEEEKNQSRLLLLQNQLLKQEAFHETW